MNVERKTRLGTWALILMILAGLALARVSHAQEVYIGGGVFTTLGPVAEAAMQVETQWKWLRPEVEVLGASRGAIISVTPYLTWGESIFVQAGLGIGDNLVNAPATQTRGLIFHDSVCAGIRSDWSAKLCADHYSNGGSFNPLFGHSPNAGFSGLIFMLGRRW